MRFPTAREGFRIGSQFICGFQQNAPSLQQHPPDIGEFGAMARAVKQHHIQLFFQFLHGVAKCGRHASQLIRRRRKTAPAIDRIHNP
ncbi:Uncharacterised protein [Shigella sonnei]|nr:Uncharacterised protein [Shigella sonnei]CSF31866.1 Uncharacterised protein [Shigella sonnei]CSF54139.1 Uncharacterised protein [Shigella sonnei]CSF80215.1 Uncharacterised protein [Shigella sonnei]CSF97916.1 Uncharacterised protein [Shigella sonnei]